VSEGSVSEGSVSEGWESWGGVESGVRKEGVWFLFFFCFGSSCSRYGMASMVPGWVMQGPRGGAMGLLGEVSTW
jgi:hypothetical protein